MNCICRLLTYLRVRNSINIEGCGFTSQCLEMNKRIRLSSKDFLALADILWEGTAKVRYQNPDAWIII